MILHLSKSKQLILVSFLKNSLNLLICVKLLLDTSEPRQKRNRQDGNNVVINLHWWIYLTNI